MTATTTSRLTVASTPVPKRGTFGSAANQIFYKGTIVSQDSAGRAVQPSDGDGLNALGVSNAFYDNRTGSEAGGTADDLDVEVQYGVFGFAITGTQPAVGSVAYVVDNQTVSGDPFDASGNPRGVAGYCVQVESFPGISATQAFVWMVPGHGGAGYSRGHLSAPLGDVAFADGTVNGIDPTVYGFRYNNAIDDQPLRTILALPNDLDTGRDLIVRARAYIIDDAVDDDVVMVLVARINGGADVAPVSTTVLGESAATITFTIPAASVPAGSKALYLELDCAATLDTSDAVLEALEVEYSVKS